MTRRLKRTWAIATVVIAIVAWAVERAVLAMDWNDVASAWSALPAVSILMSMAMSLVSFCMLATLDVLSARIVVPHQVSVRRAAFAGALSHAFSNTLGFPALTGSVVRYRIYASAGVSASDIARIVALAAFGVAMGFTVITTLALIWQPTMAHGWGRPLGAVICVVLLSFLFWLRRSGRSLRIANFKLALPDSATAAWQMTVGGIEMLAAIGALYVLLPSDTAPPFIEFLPIYVGAVLVGLASNVPGGLGVFEVIVLAVFPAEARADALAAMLCYRLIYSLMPFGIAGVAWIVFESRRANAKARRIHF